ncbi:MAG: hypothetical protein IPP63_08345 [Chloracidobacterium sp.]|nr:hypothetical protein [Chloracidobacterium sp.]
MARNSVSRFPFKSDDHILPLHCFASWNCRVAFRDGEWRSIRRIGTVQVRQTPRNRYRRPTINGQRGSQQLAPLADRSTIVFGSGSTRHFIDHECWCTK